MLSQTLFDIISSPKPLNDTVDHYDVFNGDVNVINTAVDVLDTLASEIEPELLMKYIVMFCPLFMKIVTRLLKCYLRHVL